MHIAYYAIKVNVRRNPAYVVHGRWKMKMKVNFYFNSNLFYNQQSVFAVFSISRNNNKHLSH